jgi:tetratricopeptide (TPR) repeat protein
MTPEEAIQVADEVLLAHAGNPLTDIQRLILRESLAGKGYERMEGYAPQHIKNEGQKLWGLLSKALGQKVSKTSFEGALEKRWKLGELIPKPPLLSVYNPQMWVGRKAILSECLPKLRGQARVLWITGISGIGKTALGECLASQAWEGDPSFQWLYLEILEGQSPEFVSVAADLLAKLGDVDLDPQERNDPKRLMERLLRKLNVSRYWLQVDSLERLLSSEQPTETKFADQHWVTFLQRCLTEPIFASRLVLTAQALPSSLAELEDRYPNLWQVITLQGLVANQQDAQQPNEHLKLFAKNDLSVDDISAIHLRRIGQIYEGHPLVLQVIAKEILAAPFAGSVAMYWERYGNEFEQVTRELQVEWVSPELYNQALQRRVRRRVEVSLKRLPTEAFDLLCRSSVYRRPVPENFWLSLLEEHPSQLRQQAYQILNERALIEREGIHQNQFLIRQHNLVRAVAYDLFKADTQMWYQSECQAAHIWLTDYEPALDAPNLETVRGYLEAFIHYCNAGDWESANDLFSKALKPPSKSELFWLLYRWGYYQEEIRICEQLVNYARPNVKVVCYNGIGIAHYALANYSQALIAYQESLRIARQIGDKRGESNAICNLGVVYKNLGDYKQAIASHEMDLAISREIDDKWGEACALGNLGLTYNDIGEYHQAIKYHLQALATRQGTNDKRGEAADLGNLGLSYYNIGEFGLAIDYHQRCLEITRDLGSRRDECNTLSDLGLVYNALGNYQKALEYQQQALYIAVEINDKRAEGIALSDMGDIQIQLTDHDKALKNLNRALVIFREIQAKAKEAEVFKRLARLYQVLSKHDIALNFCRQALATSVELGIPLIEECQKLMEELEERGVSEGK